MHYMNCLHPPGAATALTIVLSGVQYQSMGWKWLAMIVFANTVISLSLALLFNNLLPGRRYPAQAVPLIPKASPTVIPDPADIEWAAQQMAGVIDISTADLCAIYDKAQAHAQNRLNADLTK
jgi:CBS domain-containing membrane protein